MITPADFIGAQLRAAAPDAEWNAAGVDRAIELGAMFQRAGIVDLSKLQIEPVDVWECFKLVGFAADPKSQAEYDAMRPPRRDREGGRTFVVDALGWFVGATKRNPLEMLAVRGFVPYRFRAESQAIGFLGDTNRDATISGEKPLFKYQNGLPLVAWSSRGDGHVNYALAAKSTGFAIQPFWGSSSDKAWIVESVRSLVMLWGVAFAFAGAGSMGSMLGEQIVGAQFAAAYPGVTSAIGNAALGTAMNGGDVEAAVKSAAIGGVAGSIGAAAGAQVAGVTDIDTLGRVAQAATTAYIRGGDVNAAVRHALFQSIPDAFPAASIFQETQPVDYFNSIEAFDYQVMPDPWGVSSLPGVAAPEYAPMPSVLDFVPETGGGMPASGGGLWQTTRDWAGQTFTQENVRALRDVSADVATIIRNVRSIDNPAIAPGRAPVAPMQPPRAAVQTTQNITNPDGSMTQVAPDGSVRVIPREQVQAMRGAQGFNISPQMLAIGGAAVVAVILLASRKR